ncbi:phosphohistidine phosphatase [Salegentibacter echinorum]|uniref:Phosphohistidine phosphatase n=1 Tax=Salegentibacter echinorum TaxID=1073325 RepID=A0A1M5D1E6_SALEC|nr:histidine phosphatase family protein [Salegentibacter echinorum]SHF60655.1 phosphohistidine phosphatase [Salegentibacter echinorum]
MKRLILIRHGKSSREHNVTDKKRPLKERAYNDAALVLEVFKQFQEEKPFIWSSPATRAQSTAKIFKDELNIDDNNFEIIEPLYTFEEKELLNTIKTCPNEIDTLMVFGHNPAMTEVVNTLGDKEFENVPTTGLNVIDFEVHKWPELDKGKNILHLFPKNLR